MPTDSSSITGAVWDVWNRLDFDRQVVTLAPRVPEHFTITGLDPSVTAAQLPERPVTWSAADLVTPR